MIGSVNVWEVGFTGLSMKFQITTTLQDVAAYENLLEAWREFVRGKSNKADVGRFYLNLMDNITSLHNDLVNIRYKHGAYHAFNINDPKPRSIHKASVRDRLLHHALHGLLYPSFDRTFIADSYSCRIGKGTHKALRRFRAFGRTVGRNNTRTCWVLKCDIRKFFASIDHAILMRSLEAYIPDRDLVWLLGEVISSFSSTAAGVGLPLGNLTSQLFVNVYMNAFDQFVKHELKAKFYIRYTDDFVILSTDRALLEQYLVHIRAFLRDVLKLELHPLKVSIRTLASGVDFLGWTHFADHTVLRPATRRRMEKRLQNSPSGQTASSYRGLLRHGNSHKLKQQLFGTAA